MSSTTEQKISAGDTADKLAVTTTCTAPSCTTVKTEQHDKYQFMANLSNEKARNLTEIATKTQRNTEIDGLLAQIQSL